jgi:two-component system NtrC family response regulator
VAPLAHFFLDQPRTELRFAPQALDAIMRYTWPGNVRELRNAVMRAAALAQNGTVRTTDLPVEVRSGAAPAAVGGSDLARLERRAILDALARTGGHYGRAAELLGISTRTLSRKLKSYAVQAASTEIGEEQVADAEGCAR